MLDSFVFAGFGGQGVMFAGQILAYAGMNAGREVTWIPSYGPEMRGGTANCTVVISDKPIGAPVVRRPTVVVAFNNPSYDKYEPVVAINGVLARNASLVHYRSDRTDILELSVPAQEIAESIGDVKLVNIVLLGAVLAARPSVPLAAVEQALDAHMPAHRRHLLPKNLEALARGAAIQAESKVNAVE